MSSYQNVSSDGTTVTLGLNGNDVIKYTANGLILKPPVSLTPANNGEVMFQLTSNTQLTVKVKGSDGVVRSTNLTLA